MNSSDIVSTPEALNLVAYDSTMLHTVAVLIGSGLLFFSLFRSKRLWSPVDVLIHEEEKEQTLLQPLTTNYLSTPPIKFRPYKPKFHIPSPRSWVARRNSNNNNNPNIHSSTIAGIQPVTPNDLILIDNTYKSRLAYRRRLLRCYPTETYGSLPTASWAVSELYTYIFSEHLPTRFPAQFTKSPSGALVQNRTTAITHPIIPQSATLALRALGENLDEDFVILLPSEEDGTYHVGAFVVCFPNGFSLDTKLGVGLNELRAAAQEVKLGKSLQRYMSEMQPGVAHAVQRVNWSVARSDELFCPDPATHEYDSDDEVVDDEHVQAEDCCLRVERQTLWKLPETGAIVFGTKTYMSALADIKAEEGDEAMELADAIEDVGTENGNYKACGAWGEKVLTYLRN